MLEHLKRERIVRWNAIEIDRLVASLVNEIAQGIAEGAVERAKANESASSLIGTGLIPRHWWVAHVSYQLTQCKRVIPNLTKISSVGESPLKNARWYQTVRKPVVHKNKKWLTCTQGETDFV